MRGSSENYLKDRAGLDPSHNNLTTYLIVDG